MTQLLLDERQRLKVVVQFLTERKKVKKKVFHFKASHNGYAEHTEFHKFNAFAPASFLVAHPFELLRPVKKVQGSV